MLVMQSYIWNCNPKFKNLAAGRTLQKNKQKSKTNSETKKKQHKQNLYNKTLPKNSTNFIKNMGRINKQKLYLGRNSNG